MFHRNTLIRQTDESDCGAAALASVALHYRKPVALQKVRQLAGTDRAGTTFEGLVKAAETLGFLAKGVKTSLEGLPEVPLPAIARVVTPDGLGHFVVLQKVASRRVTIADPAAGVSRVARETFAEQWTGHLLLVVPDETHDTVAVGEAPLPAWRRLTGLLSQQKGLLAEAFCCALFMALLGIGTSYAVQHLVDSALVRHETGLLNAVGIVMVLIVIFRTLFSVLRQYLLAHVGRRIDLSLIARYSRHVIRLPVSFFELRQVGEIISRMGDAGRVRDAVSGTALTVLIDGALVAISLTALWAHDAPLAFAATAFVPILVACVGFHQPRIRRGSRLAMESAARLSAQLVEDVSGVDTIKAFGLERARSRESESRLVRVVQSAFSLQILGMSMSTVGSFVTGIAGAVILWYGGHRVAEGALTVGQLLFFYTLLAYMLGPLERLAGVNLQIQDALVAIQRLYEVMDLEVERLGERDHAPITEVRKGIELRDVSFRYGCRAKVLDGINLKIAAGSTVAIVGESGSGKSTLLKLFLRFYDPTDGRVVVDGLDARDIELSSLRSRIGLVSQDPFLFSGTLRDNLALGSPSATMEDIVEATRQAGLEEFVDALPDRYDTVIGERGANLSGGQRQRLAIARALLRRPDVLIFDEATSHLDTATERAVQRSLRTVFEDKTVILVAHRLSTIQDADQICVLDSGRLTEQGTHQELLARGERYAALWKAQASTPVESHTRKNGVHRKSGAIREAVLVP